MSNLDEIEEKILNSLRQELSEADVARVTSHLLMRVFLNAELSLSDIDEYFKQFKKDYEITLALNDHLDEH